MVKTIVKKFKSALMIDVYIAMLIMLIILMRLINDYDDRVDSDLEHVVVVVESKEVGKQEEEEFSILVVDMRIPLCSR